MSPRTAEADTNDGSFACIDCSCLSDNPIRLDYFKNYLNYSWGGFTDMLFTLWCILKASANKTRKIRGYKTQIWIITDF